MFYESLRENFLYFSTQNLGGFLSKYPRPPMKRARVNKSPETMFEGMSL